MRNEERVGRRGSIATRSPQEIEGGKEITTREEQDIINYEEKKEKTDSELDPWARNHVEYNDTCFFKGGRGGGVGKEKYCPCGKGGNHGHDKRLGEKSDTCPDSRLIPGN